MPRRRRQLWRVGAMVLVLSLMGACRICANNLPAIQQMWDQLLTHYTAPMTKKGRQTTGVDYTKLAESQTFRALIRLVESQKPQQFQTHQQRLAFWINVYNIAAVKLIVENYPITSIRALSTRSRPVWKRRLIVIDGYPYSLTHIQNGILRQLGDRRIAYALVCATLSCPDLRGYHEASIDEELNAAKTVFLSNPTKRRRLPYCWDLNEKPSS